MSKVIRFKGDGDGFFKAGEYFQGDLLPGTPDLQLAKKFPSEHALVPIGGRAHPVFGVTFDVVGVDFVDGRWVEDNDARDETLDSA